MEVHSFLVSGGLTDTPYRKYVAEVNSKMPDELTDDDFVRRAVVIAKVLAEVECGPLKECEDSECRLDAFKNFCNNGGKEWSE